MPGAMDRDLVDGHVILERDVHHDAPGHLAARSAEIELRVLEQLQARLLQERQRVGERAVHLH